MILQYGKYRGCDIRDVPLEYLEWLSESNKETQKSLAAELRRRELDEEQDSSMAERIIKTGYRELSKKYHPDAGGNHTDMVDLNAAMEQLKECL